MSIERTRRVGHLVARTACSLIADRPAVGSTAEQLMATHARTFYFAARFFPLKYRQSVIDLYAFFRSLDDVVDESETDWLSREVIKAELDDWDRWFQSGLSGHPPRAEIGKPLARVVKQHEIPLDIFREFLEGMRSDLNPREIGTRVGLESYCYKVASTVGIAMTCVFGANDEPARLAAIRLGIAMQLTNILRDIGGDLSRGRVYIPRDLMDANSLDARELFQMKEHRTGPDDRLRTVMSEMIQWADDHYRAGNDGVRYLPEEVQLPILLASRLYQSILRQIERNGYDSLRVRASTNSLQKAIGVCKCALELTGSVPSGSVQDPTLRPSINIEKHTSS